jgi:MFS transporter, PPP family, 3-phenylpropionic acid transporter
MKKVWAFLFYFTYFAAGAALFPYMALYYQSIGLSGAQMGLLGGLVPLISMVGAPLWTGMADATNRPRLILSMMIIAATGAALTIPAAHGFLPLILAVSAYSLFSAPIASMGDSITMSSLGEERGMYGRLRLGGTIAWGIMSYIVGRVLDRNGILWAFWMYAAGMMVNLLVAQGFGSGHVRKQVSYWSGVGRLLSDRRWGLFLAIAFLSGAGTATINIYQFVYMADMGASKSLMGLSLTLSTLSELPVLFFGGWLLKRLGAQGLMLLGMLVVGVRLVLYAAFPFPAAILAIQIVHGLTFAAIWMAAVTYAHEIAPPGLSATAQGLFGAMMLGLGGAAGGFLGGLLIGAVGARFMYLAAGLAMLAGVLVFALFRRQAAARSLEIG